MNKVLLSSVLALSSLAANAAFSGTAVKIGDMYFKLDEAALQAAVANAYYDGQDTNCYKGDITVPSTVSYNGQTYTVTTIGQFAFNDYDQVTSVTLPETITTIAQYGFDATLLTELVIPNSVTQIGSKAFEYSMLKKITLGSGIVNIDGLAFDGCSELTDVTTLATTPYAISANTFPANVKANVTLHVPAQSVEAYKSATNWGGFKAYAAISDTPGTSTIVDMIENGGLVYMLDHDNLTAKLAAAYKIKASFNVAGYSGAVVVPETVEANEKTYTVTSLEAEAFYQMEPVTIKLPETLLTVGWETFWAIPSLENLVFPNSVETIEDGCVWGCKAITEITLGSGMKTLGGKSSSSGYCFGSLDALTNITSLATTPPTATATTFQPQVKANATLTVPAGTVEAYKAAPNWDGFKEYIEMTNPGTGVDTIDAAGTMTVRYFTLQGMEITNPAEGQIVIEIRNGKSIKTVFRK